MKFNKFEEARKNPENVTDLDLSLHSTDKIFKDHNYDASDISDLIGDLSEFNNLETLKLSAFPINDKLLNSIWGLKKIKNLTFWNVELKDIPDGISMLPDLESLLIQYELEIKTIPNWVGQLTNLKTLGLYGCHKLESLPKEISNLINLEELILGENRKLKEVAIEIISIPNLDKESKKTIEKLIKKIEKSKQKTDQKKLNEIEKLLSKFGNKPCIINYNDQKLQGVIFNWKSLDDSYKEVMEDALGDEMFENKKLLPIGVFSSLDENISYSNCEEYLDNAEQPDLYLMINKDNKKIFESGLGEIDITMKDLSICLK